MATALRLDPTPVDLSGEELGSPVGALPQIWQDIASGAAPCASHDHRFLVRLAQAMHYQWTTGAVDFVENVADPKLREQRRQAFVAVHQPLAEETLTWFGVEWNPERYPNPDEWEGELDPNAPDYEGRLAVIEIARTIFDKFGYLLPASFYHCFGSPLGRDDVHRIVMLRFDESVAEHARSWDSMLHASGKVFEFMHWIQAISSQHDKLWRHSCNCSHGLGEAVTSQSRFTYELSDDSILHLARAVVHTAMTEFAAFRITPVTKLTLTG